MSISNVNVTVDIYTFVFVKLLLVYCQNEKVF